MGRRPCCKDCIFMTSRPGLVTTKLVCTAPGRSGRRVREGDPACPEFKRPFATPGLGLVAALKRGLSAEKSASAPAARSRAAHATRPADARPSDARPASGSYADGDLDLEALEARAEAAEARAAAAEARAAAAEARARRARPRRRED